MLSIPRIKLVINPGYLSLPLLIQIILRMIIAKTGAKARDRM
jgi:hypothetical protein